MIADTTKKINIQKEEGLPVQELHLRGNTTSGSWPIAGEGAGGGGFTQAPPEILEILMHSLKLERQLLQLPAIAESMRLDTSSFDGHFLSIPRWFMEILLYK